MRHGQIVELNPELTNTVSGTPCCSPRWTRWHYAPDAAGSAATFGGRWAATSCSTARSSPTSRRSKPTRRRSPPTNGSRSSIRRSGRSSSRARISSTCRTRSSTRGRSCSPTAALKLTGKLARADVAVLSAVDQVGRRHAERASARRHRASATEFRRPIARGLAVQRPRGDRPHEPRLRRRHAHRLRQDLLRAVPGRGEHDTSRTARRNPVRCGRRWSTRTGRELRDFTTTCSASTPSFAPTTASCRARGSCSRVRRTGITLYGKPGALIERFNVFITENALWRLRRLLPRRSVCSRTSFSPMMS